MRRSTQCARLLSIALALHVHAAGAQEVDKIFIVNGMQDSIVELALSPPGLGIWSDNLLSPPPIEPGEARKIAARPFAEKCVQDVRARLAGGGGEVFWKSLKLCNVKKLGLFRDRDSGRTSATYE
jgi:hypothetical protein